MTLYEEVKKNRLAAMKAGSMVQSILTVFLGEIERLKGKEEITDQKIVAIAKKLIASNKEVLVVTQDPAMQKLMDMEIGVLSQYLPQQLTEEQIAGIIASNDLTSIKEVMAFMKANYAGLYDGKLVSSIFTSYGSVCKQ